MGNLSLALLWHYILFAIKCWTDVSDSSCNLFRRKTANANLLLVESNKVSLEPAPAYGLPEVTVLPPLRCYPINQRKYGSVLSLNKKKCTHKKASFKDWRTFSFQTWNIILIRLNYFKNQTKSTLPYCISCC